MVTTTEEILAPQTILKTVSQLDLPGTALQRLMGWGFGGKNVARQAGRHFAYDIFDATRTVATGRAPGQAAVRQAPHGVGQIVGTFPRAAEVIPLLDEDLLNRRALGAAADQLDEAGESFITRQEVFLAQRFANLVEFQTAAMFRGKYHFDVVGDELRHRFDSGAATIDFQLPTGNTGQLDLLGAGNVLDADWNDPATDIPLHLQNVNAAFVRLTGLGLAHVIVTGAGWQMIVNNTKVQALGGSASVAYDSLRRIGPGEFAAVLKAIPWITFHVIDYGLEVWNGTSSAFQKLIDDHCAAFLPQPSSRWAQYLEGSEIVTEGPGGSKSERFGFYAYGYPTHDPSGWELAAVFNGLPALCTPAAVAYGQITGGSY